jgi:outer membrane cobalamin receptor
LDRLSREALLGSRCPLVVALSVTLSLSCAVHGSRKVPGNDGDRIFITADQIAHSGSATAWEALRKLVPQLTYGERKSGQPSRLERRGQSSLLLNDAPLVFLDGVRMPDFRNLQQLSASTIESIEVLNGIDGTTYYGSNAVSGVILIRTKNGSS